jgi:hypothetical protein
MKIFSTIEKKDYTINKYNATAVLDWEFVSASHGVALTIPVEFSGSTEIITINKARKKVNDTIDYNLINVDTGYYHNSLHASIDHLFYSNNSFFFSGSLLVTSSVTPLANDVYVISIPQNLYGDKVKPGSFELQIDSITPKIRDDEYGNLRIIADGSGNEPAGTVSYLGNIFYDKGMAVITEDTIADTGSFSVTNSGASSYSFTGDVTGNNPTLTLIRGNYYQFSINATGHPFWIQTTSGGYNAGNVYNTGITNNGTQSGSLIFQVPLSAPDTLYYYCQFHSSMGGTINIVNPGPSVSSEGIKIVSGSKITLSYDSSLELEQHQINIRVGPEDYNHSIFNPSTKKSLSILSSSISQSNGSVINLVEAGVPSSSINEWVINKLMGSDIVKPYITTIGLYNDQYELLAIAKFSTPIQRTFDTEQIFIIRFDIDNTVV